MLFHRQVFLPLLQPSRQPRRQRFLQPLRGQIHQGVVSLLPRNQRRQQSPLPVLPMARHHQPVRNQHRQEPFPLHRSCLLLAPQHLPRLLKLSVQPLESLPRSLLPDSFQLILQLSAFLLPPQQWTHLYLPVRCSSRYLVHKKRVTALIRQFLLIFKVLLTLYKSVTQ